MKIIDLLNKIANGEKVPQEIRYKHKEYKWERNVDYKEKNERNFLLSEECINETFLNDELEIIEEKKEIEETFAIELLGQCDNWLQRGEGNIEHGLELNPYILDAITRNFKLLYHKQCELIDVVNSINKGK